jgi:hypothetical protein
VTCKLVRLTDAWTGRETAHRCGATRVPLITIEALGPMTLHSCVTDVRPIHFSRFPFSRFTHVFWTGLWRDGYCLAPSHRTQPAGFSSLEPELIGVSL